MYLPSLLARGHRKGCRARTEGVEGSDTAVASARPRAITAKAYSDLRVGVDGRHSRLPFRQILSLPWSRCETGFSYGNVSEQRLCGEKKSRLRTRCQQSIIRHDPRGSHVLSDFGVMLLLPPSLPNATICRLLTSYELMRSSSILLRAARPKRRSAKKASNMIVSLATHPRSVAYTGLPRSPYKAVVMDPFPPFTTPSLTTPRSSLKKSMSSSCAAISKRYDPNMTLRPSRCPRNIMRSAHFISITLVNGSRRS